MELDRFDRLLLREIQLDARQSAERLAEKVHLSPSSVQRRLQKLRSEGVITAEVAVVDPEAAGLGVTLIVSVTLENEGLDGAMAFRRAMREEPWVREGYFVTGDHDYVLILTVPDMDAYESFHNRHLLKNPFVKSFKTGVVMNTFKYSTALPVL